MEGVLARAQEGRGSTRSQARKLTDLKSAATRLRVAWQTPPQNSAVNVPQLRGGVKGKFCENLSRSLQPEPTAAAICQGLAGQRIVYALPLPKLPIFQGLDRVKIGLSSRKDPLRRGFRQCSVSHRG